jgi:predicted nucleic acid-binding protein
VIVFADTSALGSAYLDDEADGAWIREVLFDGEHQVVISQLADVEFASLMERAKQTGRIDEAGMAERLQAFGYDTDDHGTLAVVPLTSDTFLVARQFVLAASLRTLDALQLACADMMFNATSEPVSLLTRDGRQAQAAVALGFTLFRPVGQGDEIE